MRHCSICGIEVDEQSAPILAMGGFGNPKYLCDKCAADIDIAISAKEPEKIELAMSEISDRLSSHGTDDMLVVNTVKDIFAEAGERARKIKEGTYDFSEEQDEKEEELDVPEELLETEEDKEKDEIDAKKNKLIDKIFNWVSLAVILAAAVLAVIAFVF